MSPYLVIFQGCLETCSFRTKACLACVHTHTKGFKSGTGVTSAQHPPPQMFLWELLYACLLPQVDGNLHSQSCSSWEAQSDKGSGEGVRETKRGGEGSWRLGKPAQLFSLPKTCLLPWRGGSFCWGIFFFPLLAKAVHSGAASRTTLPSSFTRKSCT